MEDSLRNSNNTTISAHVVSGFYLLSEAKPMVNGKYEVVTNRGRVLEVNFESFLGNSIWETDHLHFEQNEEVIAWRWLLE